MKSNFVLFHTTSGVAAVIAKRSYRMTASSGWRRRLLYVDLEFESCSRCHDLRRRETLIILTRRACFNFTFTIQWTIGKHHDVRRRLDDPRSRREPLPRYAQPVVAPLTRDTIFLVVTVNPGAESLKSVRSFCGDLPKLLRAVGFRDLEGNLSCVLGFGSELGTASLASRDPRNSIHFAKSAPARAMPSPRPAIYSFISAPSARILLRVGVADHGKIGRCRHSSGRGARLPLFRCARSARFR